MEPFSYHCSTKAWESPKSSCSVCTPRLQARHIGHSTNFQTGLGPSSHTKTSRTMHHVFTKFTTTLLTYRCHPSSSLHHTSTDMTICSSTQFQKLLLILINSQFTHGPYGSGIIYPALQSPHLPLLCSKGLPYRPSCRGMQPPVGSRILSSCMEAWFLLAPAQFLLYILELFGTVTVLFPIAVGQWRHHTNHPGSASLYKLLQGLPLQVSRGSSVLG